MMSAATIEQRQAAEAALTALFSARGLTRAEPGILQPADIFLDLSGEDIRRRLYLVQDPQGCEFCLRPDYTIPVSRDHLLAGSADPAGYCYLGPVFRYRSGQAEPGEFLQAGMECFGETDIEVWDAEIVAFALEAVRAFGLERPAVRLGDPGLFMAFVAGLGLPEPWPRRLRAGFGRAGGLGEALSPSENKAEEGSDFLATLAAGDAETARAAVEEMMAVAGIAPVGGRSAEEIAERLLEKAQLTAGGGMERQAREILRRAAAVRGAPAEAVRELAGIATDAGIDIGEAIASFERRLAAMADRGVPVGEIGFAADFGRRLDYYTGYVFEIYDPAHPEAQVVGGGRYDRLMSMLGAPEPVPAVGCAIWIDRLTPARRV